MPLPVDKIYDDVFSHPQAQKVLADLMRRFNCFETTFDVDPHAAAFNEGQRSVVIYILERIKFDRADPARYLEKAQQAGAL